MQDKSTLHMFYAFDVSKEYMYCVCLEVLCIKVIHRSAFIGCMQIAGCNWVH